jgi:mannose/fructose/N-acetylgalactosamine-specific phosphotransferase system component IIB
MEKEKKEVQKKEELPKNVSLNEETIPFVRVGCTYYKRIIKRDRQGINRSELKVWKKEEIVLDYGKDYLKTIPHYDDFVMKPDNIKFESEVNGCLNLYSEFPHIPIPGEWLWTQRLLKHVFGDQYELGIRYLQILYLYPEHSTVILALVSTERQTGKTTFINWINALFGANVAVISSTDFISSFNSHYASKNIICIEETLLDKKLTIEKLKALATAKFVQINEKFVTPYKIPFFGKIILTSNNEDKFAIIDQEEIRFFVRKLGDPEHKNTAIEDNLIKEIPAFLYHLSSLPSVDWSVSRSGFTPEELKNNSLALVVRESKSNLYKDLEMMIIDFFNDNEIENFQAIPSDIKDRFFYYKNDIGLNYIRKVLKDEFRKIPEDMQKYNPFGDDMKRRTGTPYRFLRSEFMVKK